MTSNINKKPNPIALVRKITLSAILMALAIICIQFLSIRIPILPSARVSFGPGLIIFASIYLGPLWGMVVGAGADVLGWLFFDTTRYPYSPGITIMYAILGVVSWVVYKLITKIRNQDNLLMLFVALVMALVMMVIPSIFGADDLLLWVKITLFSIVIVSTLGMLLFLILYANKKKKENRDIKTVLQFSTTCLILEILVIMLFGGLIKSLFFSMPFELVVFIQLVLLFINVPVNTFLNTLLSGLLNSWRVSRV